MTAAFQGNAFQPNAFQMGTDGAFVDPTQHAIKSDGNETAIFALEAEVQQLSVEGTTTYFDIEDGPCIFPAVKASATFTGTTGPHAVTLPSYSAGDRIFILAGGDNNDNVVSATTASGNFSILLNPNDVHVLYKDMNGSEGATVTITLGTSTSDFTAVLYTVAAGTFSPQLPEASSVASGNNTTPDPPSLSTTWNEKTLVFAYTISTNSETYSAYPYPNFQVATTTSPVRVAACVAAEPGQTFNPGTFTMSTGNWTAITVAQQGVCPPPMGQVIVPDVYELGLELPSGEGFSQGQAPYSGGTGGTCSYPSFDYVEGAAGTDTLSTHTVTLPASLAVGEGLLIGMKLSGSTPLLSSVPAGWEVINQPVGADGAPLFLYRIVDGTEGPTVDIVTSAIGYAAWYVWRFSADTTATGIRPFYNDAAGTATTADPPSLTAPWASTLPTLFIAGASGSSSTPPTITAFPTIYNNAIRDQVTDGGGGVGGRSMIGWAALQSNTGTSDPGTFTLASGTNTPFGWIVAIPGLCGFEPQEPNLVQTRPDTWEHGFDLYDYQGTVEKELPEDVDLPQGIFRDGNDQVGDPTYTDFTDYGTRWEPQVPDAESCAAPTVKGNNGSQDATLPSVSVNINSSDTGDLVIVWLVSDAPNASWTTTSGWQQLATSTGNSGSNAVFWKRRLAADGNTITFTQTGGTTRTLYFVRTISGWDGFVAPTAASTNGATSTTITLPSVSFDWNDPTLFIGFLSYETETAVITAYPAGYENDVEGFAGTTDAIYSTTASSVSPTSPENPGSYTIDLASNYQTALVAIKGFCGLAPLYSPSGSEGYDLHNDTDFTDYGSFTPRGVPDFVDTGECSYPTVVGYTDEVFLAATSFAVTLPSDLQVGDRLVLVAQCPANTSYVLNSDPVGWTIIYEKVSGQDRPLVFYRQVDGSEGSTVTFGVSVSVRMITSIMQIRGSDPETAPTFGSAATGDGTVQIPHASLGSGFGTTEVMWVAFGAAQNGTAIALSSYPTGYTNGHYYETSAGGDAAIVFSTNNLTTTPEDPSSTLLVGAADSTTGFTAAFKGICGLICVQSDQVPDDSYGWDYTDYGTQSDPQIEDYIEPQLAPQVTPDDSEILVDDFDYGTQSDPLAGDVDLGQAIIEDGNTRDDTDYADYGYSIGPLADDADLGQSIIEDGNTRDDTDYADYGFSVAPLADDNDLPFQTRDDGTNLGDPTGADWFEYGTQTDPLAPDFPQDQLLGLYDATEFEDATFTDWTEYGTQNGAYETFIVPEDKLLGIDDGTNLEDPTGADWFEYGTQSDPQIGDADLGQSIISDGTNVEDPTFTDFTDYGTQSDPQIADADLGQAIIDSGVTVEDPTFTDFTDYGTQTNPLAPDFPQDFLLGIDSGVSVEDPTGADWFEYGTQSDPLADDVDLGQAIIEDGNTRDDTDYADYGFNIGPLAGDVDLGQTIISDGTNLEDPTGADWFEYGFNNNPLPPDFPEDQILGIDDGTNLDDPTGADWFEYGTQSDILEILRQDFALGDGKGLDTQDFTDLADYGFTQDGISNMEGGILFVDVTGVEGVFEIGCIHTVSWADIPDVVKSWSEITNTDATWSPIADVPKTWTETPNTSDTWTEIPNTSNPWEEDC